MIVDSSSYVPKNYEIIFILPKMKLYISITLLSIQLKNHLIAAIISNRQFQLLYQRDFWLPSAFSLSAFLPMCKFHLRLFTSAGLSFSLPGSATSQAKNDERVDSYWRPTKRSQVVVPRLINRNTSRKSAITQTAGVLISRMPLLSFAPGVLYSLRHFKLTLSRFSPVHRK